MFHKAILSMLYGIFVLVISISQIVEGQRMFILQRFNWLKDFGSCFNFVLALDGVQYAPKVPHQRIETLVPYVNYRKLQTSLPYKFQRWTTCQTLSIVLNFDYYMPVRKMSNELLKVLNILGFDGANACLPFGHLCSVVQYDFETIFKPSSIHQRPLGMYPLQIFFVLPDTPGSNKFTLLTVIRKFQPNPFHQKLFRIIFPVQEKIDVSGNFIDAILVEESLCKEITFLCMYCNTSINIYTQTQYLFTDMKSSCDSADLQNILLNLYFNATGNGKKLTYFRYLDNKDLQTQIDTADFTILQDIQNAKSIFDILNRRPKPSIDHIITSILFDDFGAGISTALQSSIGLKTFYHLLKAADNRSNSKSSSNFKFLKTMNFSLKQDYDNAQLMFHTHPAPPNINTSIALSLIGKCDKTAYVGRQPEIHRLVNDFYEENNTFIYAGKAHFLEIPSVWHAQESGGYFIKERMSYLGESGIYDFWKGWIERGWERKGGGSIKIRKISLASNIVVIFFVIFWANVIAILTFITELLIFRGCNSKPQVDRIKVI
ncbi:unnamed protein product [Orchesella dallaii]|uniref:Uncharacterized protein n=1 Tax=Orchesella dallaii TaxID=48710 RepID=A0ABP1RG93_9HEXA